MTSITAAAPVASAHAQNLAAMQQASAAQYNPADSLKQVTAGKTTGAGAAEMARQQAVTRAQLTNAVSPMGGNKRVAANNEALKPSAEQAFEAPGLKMKNDIARQARQEVKAAIEASFLQSMMESTTGAARDKAMQAGEAMARSNDNLVLSMDMPEASRAFRAEQEMSTKRFEAQLAELRSMVMGQAYGPAAGMDIRA